MVLIDGNSLAYRAFYALPDTMRTTTGITTNAIYGFTTMLIKVLDGQPDFVAIAFDRPEPTFRHTEYKEYKAKRIKAPPELYSQIPKTKEALSAFGVQVFEKKGFEADDLIGSVVREASSKGFDVTIVSGDKDMLQLITPRIKIYDPMKDKHYGESEVVGRFGIQPAQVVEIMALMGDSIDNIPGVSGIGEKTAKELISMFGNVENLLTHLEDVKKPRIVSLVDSSKIK